MAAVVVHRPGVAVDGQTVVYGIAGRLARFKHPRQVVFVDELPRITMGKVQKNVPREYYAGPFLEEA